MPGKIPTTIFRLVEPAVWTLAARLLILTTDRKGSKKSKPNVSTFYETGIVTAIYEAMLMSAVLSGYDIRHEEPYKSSKKGAPKQVDLWLRPCNGGIPMLIEAGDFSVGKVHRDLAKIKSLNPNGTNWFLAFFRQDAATAADPLLALQASFGRKNGLDATKVKLEPSLVRSFDVFRPNGAPDKFGVALLRGK
ncbi:hypothetical protein [Burkholderia sp. LMG 21824]|uniref:hypothetical protein n=1 Tax=Burkholderia sp. LMG 21824 TaxID=3158172 RepID=UPI003C2C8155